MTFRRLARSFPVLAILSILSVPLACAKTRDSAPSRPRALALSVATTLPTRQPDEAIARIRDEGLNHSQAMQTLDYLCNVIGARLTGSPACRRANQWTCDRLESWGLTNAHLEAWGPFGRGWSLRRFSMQVTEPYAIVLNGYPRAWSPGFDQPLEAPVAFVDATKDAELDAYNGKLKGAIVLVGRPRELEPRFQPLATRMTDAELTKLATAQPGSSALMGQPRTETAADRRAQFEASGALGEQLMNRRRGGATTTDSGNASPTTEPTTRPGGRRGFDPFAARALKFVADEGAALVVTPSTQGDGGTIFVASASIPGDLPFGAGGGANGPTTRRRGNRDDAGATTQPGNRSSLGGAPTTGPTTRPRVWSLDAPKIPPQVTLAVEDYNRLARMIRRGEKLTIACDLQVQFHDDDPMAYNTVAEIPGTDLKDQVVMVGGHLDSWHSGTGATDNAVGAVAAMEAVRIIQALNLHPRRTIRVALWTGEEQGIFGSSNYVKQHFGYDPDARSNAQRFRRVDDASVPPDAENPAATQAASRPARRIVKQPDYEKLSVYFNLDNGSGKIRGVYAQSNPAAIPLFKQWLAYFADLGATTVTVANTGSTDHVSFDQIGLPGFQFIQDQLEYSSRTHHSNQDVYDRLQPDDVKQASTILAGFLWKAAQMDERFPRKPLDARP